MNTLVITVVAVALLGVAAASFQPGNDNGAYVYHGKYPGKCSYDGLYYNDESSFVYCIHGHHYKQDCSPGTRNSAYAKFSYGESYSHRDFCDINQVAVSGDVYQYAPKYQEPKYEQSYDGPSYEEPKFQPSYDSPSYKEPKYGAPKYDAPKYDAPKYDAPKYDAPKYDAPKYDAPKYEAPKYEAPKYEAPKYEEPKYDAPTYDEPKYDAPKYEAPEPKYDEPSYDKPAYSEGPHSYHGKYSGTCEYDGLYYKDEYSFVFCSNKFNYDQPCSPGTRNSPYEKFNHGNKYNYRDFCDVNLVDGGYASHDGYGYEYAKPSYKEEEPSYDGPKYEEPKYEAPTYKEPSYDAPKYEEPQYKEPAYAAPKYEEPQYKEPSYDGPKYPEPKYEEPKYEEPSYDGPKYDEEPKKSGYTYHGKYPGQCEYDGLYYNDESSFVFCVNKADYVQPCAPGSRNSPYSKFSYGKTYSERDFCDVNLVDNGYLGNVYQ